MSDASNIAAASLHQERVFEQHIVQSCLFIRRMGRTLNHHHDRVLEQMA